MSRYLVAEESHARSRGLPGGGRSPGEPVSDIFKLAAAENSLGSANLSWKSPDFALLAGPDLSQAFELSGESESKGANSLSIGSGNNSEVREILRVNTLLGCGAVVPML